MTKRLHATAGVLIAIVLVVSSCGTSSSNTQPTYASFCAIAQKLEDLSAGTHGQDPTAMNDPKKMQASWTALVNLATQLEANAPDVVKNDISIMTKSMNNMNDVFKTHQYDLLKMAKIPEVRDTLAKISAEPSTASASTRFAAFMKENCAA